MGKPDEDPTAQQETRRQRSNTLGVQEAEFASGLRADEKHGRQGNAQMGSVSLYLSLFLGGRSCRHGAGPARLVFCRSYKYEKRWWWFMLETLGFRTSSALSRREHDRDSWLLLGPWVPNVVS